MDITSFAATPPAPGSTAPGDLYIDLQSRTLWLGVDPAVDPAESVLISDIIGLLDADAQVLLDAKAYTNTQITTRAPTVHTHPSAQITDFNAAVTNVVQNIPGANWVRGMIMLWSGSLAEIGVGDLAGWSLCDGGNGTPDLRDRFIIGAGNKPVGNKNTPANILTDLQGAHAHINDPTTLTTLQIPSHTHTVSGSGSCSGQTGIENASHTHSQYIPTTGGGAGGPYGISLSGLTTMQTAGSESANHSHAFSGSVSITGAAAASGGGGSHTHAMQSAGSHQHTVTAANIREAVPYYALAFIMKL
jgi:hypothetical protein